MTDYYVDSTVGSDANLGTSWGAGNAWATLFQATVKPILVGDRVFVKNNTAGDSWTAGKTYTFPGSSTSPNAIYSVASGTTNAPPVESDLATGATITIGTTGALNIQATIYIWGFKFVVGNTATAQNFTFSSNTATQIYDNCSWDLSGQSSGLAVLNAGGGVATTLLNPSFKFGATGQSFQINASAVRIKGGSLASAATFPTTLFKFANDCMMYVEGFDFTNLPNTSTIAGTPQNSQVYFKDCKVGASPPTYAATPTGSSGVANASRTTFSRVDNSGSVNQFSCFDYSATESRETSITRSGGGADFTGALFSKKIVTTANASILKPYECITQSMVNTLTGSAKTVTVYGNTASLPNNNDVWIETEYPKDSGDPLGGYISAEGGALSTIGPGLSPLGAASAVSSDGSTWSGGTTAFKLTTSITPQLAGPLTVRIYVAKASTTYYFDPQFTVT